MRSLIAAIAACVMLCACAQTASASASDNIYAQSPVEFGPVPVVGADKSAAVSGAPGLLGAADSGWYNGPNYQMCTILVDALPTGFLQCMYRVSALCGQAGVTYSRGAAQLDEPFASPLLLPIYTPPSLVPTGYIEIGALTDGPPGSSASIGLNAPAAAWVKSAGFEGGWCPPLLPPPVVATGFDAAYMARYCRQYPSARICQG